MPPKFKPKDGSRFAREGSPGDRVEPHVRPFVRYLESECGMAKNSVAAYAADVRRFVAWFVAAGKTSPGQADLTTLAAYLDHLHGANLATTSVARHLVSVKTFFRFLV